MALLCQGNVPYDSAVQGAAHAISTSTLWSSAIPIAALLMIIGVILVALVYMLSGIFQDDKMKVWARMELFEIIYSAIILCMAVFAVGLADEVARCVSLDPNLSPTSRALCDNPDDPFGTSTTSVYNGIPYCHMRMAISYTDTIFAETNKFALLLYGSYIYTSTFADMAINVEFVFEKAGFMTFNPLRGLFTIGNDMRSFLFDTLIKLMLVTKFQEILLVFTAKVLFPLLFIIGAVLRTFAFTRRLGGLLMALALALFFIYPMFYVFGMFILDSLKTQAVGYCVHSGQGTLDECQDSVSVFSNFYSGGSVPLIGSFNPGELEGSTKGKRSTEVFDPFVNGINGESGLPKFYTPPHSCTVPVDCIGDPKCMVDEGNGKVNYCECKDSECKLNDAANEKIQGFGSSLLQGLTERSWSDSLFITDFSKDGGYVDITARIAFFSVFFSLFGLLATIAGIRSISMFLGGDLEIAGLTHLI
ncbi:MAG: hypothetical protein ABII22_02600 [Candidatus Micrarchaeota archaeon]